MSEHKATIAWRMDDGEFTYETYPRDHEIRVEKLTIPASSAPEFKGNPDHMDPEQGLVAAISSCHMLTFLAICAKKKIGVRSYTDEAVGVLEANEEKKLAVTRVTLHPRVEFDGPAPDAETLEKLHDSAHRNCFIANSVKCEVTVAS
ncbi:MAG: OsmC family protein [Planctomycetota bacterium]